MPINRLKKTEDLGKAYLEEQRVVEGGDGWEVSLTVGGGERMREIDATSRLQFSSRFIIKSINLPFLPFVSA